MLELGLVGGWAAGGPAAGSTASANPAAGTPAASATDAPAPVDVFGSLVSAMAGNPDAQPEATDENDAAAPVEADLAASLQDQPARHGLTAQTPAAPKSGDSGHVRVNEQKDDDKPGGDSAIVIAAVQIPTQAAEPAHQRVVAIKPNVSVPADANATGSTSTADTAAASPERHAIPIDRSPVSVLAGDMKPSHARHVVDQALLGTEAPAEGEIEIPRHMQAVRRAEFAIAVQAGLEISSPATNDLNPVELALSSRTALPMFAEIKAAAPAARTETPAVVAAPPPKTSAPLHLVAPVRDVTMAAFRLSAPAVPAPSSPVDVVAPQIIQSLRVAFMRGSGEAHIRLDPRQFGDVSVSIRVEAGQVVARVQAEAPVVREWLQSNQRTLQVGLAEHQLRLGRLEVVAPGDEARESTDSDGRRQEEPTDEPPSRRHRRREPTGTFDVVA